MSSKLATWIKSKLDSFEDAPTASDWAAMEQLINAQPVLMKAPWYKTTGGISSIVGGVAIVVGSTLYFSSNNNNTSSESNSNIAIEEVSNPSNSIETPVVSNNQESIGIDAGATTNTSTDVAIEEISNNESASVESAETSTSVGGSAASEHVVAATQAPSPVSATLTTQGVTANQESSVATTAEESAQLNNESETGTSSPSMIANNEGNGGTSTPVGAAVSSAAGSVSPTASNSPNPSNASNSSANSNDVAANTSESADVTQIASNQQQSSQVDAQNEDARPEIVSRPESERGILWSVNGYGDFSPSANSNNMELGPSSNLNQRGTPFGLGVEVTATYNSWTLSSGMMAHQENFEFTRESQSTQTNITYTSWFEVDTIVTSYTDSSWVITGINQGHWEYYTNTVETYVPVQYERADTTEFVAVTLETRQVNGYRLSVPLLVGYEWDAGKWRTAVQTGPVFTFASASWYNGQNFIETRNQLGTDLMIRAELGYEFVDRLEIFGRAGFRINATAYQNLRAGAWTKTSYPLSIGLRYQF